MEDYIAAGYEWTFDSPAGPNLLELQWALQPRFYAVDFDMDGLFERAVKVTLAGRSVKTPSPEDLLLVLAVHAAKHVWGRLIWLCDIAQILKRENLDWDRVQDRAREFGIERILHITFLLANRFLETAIPEAIESAVLADQAARGLAEEIAAALAAGVSYNTQQISYFRLMMRLRERRADRMRFLSAADVHSWAGGVGGGSATAGFVSVVSRRAVGALGWEICARVRRLRLQSAKSLLRLAALGWTAEAAVPTFLPRSSHTTAAVPRTKSSLAAGQAAGGFAAVHGVDVAGRVGGVVGG